MKNGFRIGCTALTLLALSLLAPADRAAAQDGQLLFETHCQACHGWQGTGGTVGRPLHGVTACSIDRAIHRFILGMEFLDFLTVPELLAIEDYMNSFDVDGEDRYIAVCLGCHGKEGEGGRVGENVRGKDRFDIFEAMQDKEQMRFLLNCLTISEVRDIEQYLQGFN